MKKMSFAFLWSAITLSVVLIACSQQPSTDTSEAKTNTATTDNSNQPLQERLRRFDSLDFQFYSNQQ